MNYRDVTESAPVVLVEFYASWCPHCRHMMPIVAEIKELLEGQLKVEQFDIDENQDLAGEAGVTGVPTFLLYVDGEEVWRHSGEMSGEELLRNIQSNIGGR